MSLWFKNYLKDRNQYQKYEKSEQNLYFIRPVLRKSIINSNFLIIQYIVIKYCILQLLLYYLESIQSGMSGIKSLFKRKHRENSTSTKLNISSIFIQKQHKQQAENNNYILNCSSKRHHQFKVILAQEIIDLEKLRKLSWDGIPQIYRSEAWKLLLKYSSTNKDNQENFLSIKRKDYLYMVKAYIDNPNIELDNYEKKIYKLIHDDVVRTMPDSPLFRLSKVQQMLQRILYVWHVRHPSSGYVQGLNDIATPFLITFLSDYIHIDIQSAEVLSSLKDVDQKVLCNAEADSYWCFTKILNDVLDNYANSWPGIQKSYLNIKEIFNRVDPQLLGHFQKKGIDFYHIYFKWVTCLLLRQFSTKIGLRLFDTYIALQSSEGKFFNFIQYIFCAIFLKHSKGIKGFNFEQLMTFEHKMPTKRWNQEQISTIIAEAFVYQNFFNLK